MKSFCKLNLGRLYHTGIILNYILYYEIIIIKCYIQVIQVTRFKIIPFVLLITTGFYKAAVKDLPIDITLLSAIITAMNIILIFIKSNFRINKALFIIMPLFMLIFPFVRFGSLSEYARSKALFWFTLTFLSAIAPLFLLKKKSDLTIFIKSIIGIYIVVAASATITLITKSGINRLTAFGGNTIALGRANGILAVCIFIYMLQRKIKYKLAVPLLCLIMLMLISSGSKGPILFTPLTIFIVFAMFKWKNKTMQALAVILSIMILAGFISFNRELIPAASLYRVQEFLSGGIGTSTSARLIAWKNSIYEISINPIGIGFGNSEKIINANMKGKTFLMYPHNIMLEAFLECGWAYGLFFIFILGFSAYRAYKISLKDRDYIIIFALLIFLLMSSMVSGDMNDRMLFAFIGLVLSYKPKAM